jgi:hypothetical protein
VSNSTLGILIGGLAPALLFGLFAVFTKASSQHLLATSPYLVILGLAITAVGALSAPVLGTGLSTLTAKGIGLGVIAGLFWGVAMLLVSFALLKLHTPISVLAPLYNMNTLVAVVLGLWIFSEWREAQVVPLIAGAILITAGGIIVARA